jgi:DNA-binding response OmpR family regulator
VSERKRVLVCDDDPLLVDLVSHRLSSRGYDVTVAADGAEALQLMSESPPDALVLDAMMPVLDGYELLRRVREDPRTVTLPVIMLSARRQEQDVLSALELGASDYIVKPFIPEELVVRLGRVLEQAPAR